MGTHASTCVAQEIGELAQARQRAAEHLQVRRVTVDAAHRCAEGGAQAHAPPTPRLALGERVSGRLPVHRVVPMRYHGHLLDVVAREEPVAVHATSLRAVLRLIIRRPAVDRDDLRRHSACERKEF